MRNNPVSVIVPTCGRDAYFVSCLESLRRQTCPPEEVILVNNSLDETLEQKAREAYPSIKIITPGRNLYYGESLNRGIAISTGDFVLCLNDDATLDKDFIREALKGFHTDETIGMVSGKILRPDRKTVDTTGLFLTVWRTARERGHGRPDRGQFEQEGFIFGVGGAVAFYRRKMLDEIKEGVSFFDPFFRMFYEDLDLSWRAHNRGWKAYYVPTAIACHVRGGSVRNGSGQGKALARRYLSDEFHSDLIKNRYRAISKNETFGAFCLHLIPIVFYDLCVWSYVLFFRPEVIKTFFTGLKGLSEANKKDLIKAVAKHERQGCDE
jgi:GT2 family glycosyltransferase